MGKSRSKAITQPLGAESLAGIGPTSNFPYAPISLWSGLCLIKELEQETTGKTETPILFLLLAI